MPELEITDVPPQDVRDRLQRLSDALDQTIPPKMVDRNLLVATWNVRAFGNVTKKWHSQTEDSPKRDFQDVLCIAEVASRFDVVALQEVKDNIRGLRYMMKLLGPDWAFLLTDVTKGRLGNDERMAFVFDTRRVKSPGLACELVVAIESDPNIPAGALDRQFARTPYAVSFLSADRTFVLVELHVIFGSDPAARVPELREIARWMGDWAQSMDEFGHNLIALGDFNIDRQGDPLFQAFTSTGLTPPPELQMVPRTIFQTAGQTDQFYDQIAWFPPEFSLGYTGRAGGFDFVPVLLGSLTKNQLSYRISDHYPLWVEFAIRP